ncbi:MULTISPECIES: efflux transporter outer membrane subunit [unclassified Sphingomonas]|uniref:efflux transporter outer membrane subunit n=1 Tax=unclassified Sphingomonas TaxID=196159 RepID=UPI00226AEE06|nr:MULTISPECIES: efflux transporter outer membrane subunit [unclassified Sphingomonas]
MIRRPLSLVVSLLLAGCSLAPDYHRPQVAGDVAPQWKTVAGWRPANPSDGAPRADWWTAFNDATLNELAVRLDQHNQSLAQALATYREAVAATREARASLFPTISANGAVTHSYSGSGNVITGSVISSTTGTSTGGTTTGGTSTGTGTSTGSIVSRGNSSSSYRLNLQASWQPDFFGQLTNTVRNARYTAQARAADLANTRLTLQGELVSDYLSLREADADIASLQATVTGYARALQISTNRYNAGIAARTDVFQAQSQLASAQSDLEAETRTRSQFENAIAVLIGENPATYRLASLGMRWTPVVPDMPVSLASDLLERRPDIASAERQVAAANAEIGVERAAFFPTVSLTGSGGVENGALSGLFSAGALLWSVGAQVTQTLLDFGARSARVAQAREAYNATVANYRQVTLTAFQEVQDDLIAVEVLARQEAYLRTASRAADQSEASLRNQYLAGTAIYTDVVTAAATALTARRALLQAQLDRQNAAVALVQAMGGGWTDPVAAEPEVNPQPR